MVFLRHTIPCLYEEYGIIILVIIESRYCLDYTSMLPHVPRLLFGIPPEEVAENIRKTNEFYHGILPLEPCVQSGYASCLGSCRVTGGPRRSDAFVLFLDVLSLIAAKDLSASQEHDQDFLSVQGGLTPKPF